MTQGAGQGPGTWQGGGTAADEPGAESAPPRPAQRPAHPVQPALGRHPLQPAPPAHAPAVVPAVAPSGQGTSRLTAAPAAPAGTGSPAHATAAPAPFEQAAQHPEPAMSAPTQEEDAADEHDEGYTPTERDLPVVGSGARDTRGTEPTLVDVPAQAATEEGDGPLYVVGDVHGYIDELRAASPAGPGHHRLARGDWIRGQHPAVVPGRLHRPGPRRHRRHRARHAALRRGRGRGRYCKALMGNHELLLFGAKQSGTRR